MTLHRRRSRPAATLLVALVVAALGGCGVFGDDAAPTTAAATTTTRPPTSTTTEAPVVPTGPPEVIDPGAEPRRALRLAYTEGQQAEVTFTSDLAITQRVGDRTQRLDSPPIAQTLEYTVGTVTDDGAELAIRIADVQVKPKGTGLTDDEVSELQDELDPLVGLEARAVATPLGELQEVDFDTPDDLPEATTTRLEALDDQLAAIGPTLPVEPVGVGASWRSTTTTSTGGVEMTTTSTVTLAGMDGDAVRYTATSRSTAASQALRLDRLAKGTTARVNGADLRGTTSGTLLLDRVAYDLRTTVSGTQRLTLSTAKDETALTQQIELAYVAVTGAG